MREGEDTQNPATRTTTTITSATHTLFTALATEIFATQSPSANRAPDRSFDYCHAHHPVALTKFALVR